MPTPAAGGAMRRTRPTVHKVGLTVAVFGLSALIALPFATYRTSRIQTGETTGALDALGPVWFAVLVCCWLCIAALSLRDDRGSMWSSARGGAATVAILGTVALSAVAAQRLLTGDAEFARVSVGIGAWAAIAAAYPLLRTSRREVGAASPAGIALALVTPAGIAAMLVTGLLDHLAIMREYANVSDRFASEVVAHLSFSAAALGIALVLGVALGILAFRSPRLRGPVFTIASVFQTIPGLAMVGLLFAPLSWLGSNVGLFARLGVGGLGWAPVITALTLYALLAIVRNTFAGLAGVPDDAIEAGLGMGMTETQLMFRIRFPLAMPVIFGGMRTAAVQTLGNATLGAFVAAGTLGLFVFGGLSQQAPDLIMLGSITLVAAALALDGVLGVVQRAVSPRGSQRQEGTA